MGRALNENACEALILRPSKKKPEKTWIHDLCNYADRQQPEFRLCRIYQWWYTVYISLKMKCVFQVNFKQFEWNENERFAGCLDWNCVSSTVYWRSNLYLFTDGEEELYLSADNIGKNWPNFDCIGSEAWNRKWSSGDKMWNYHMIWGMECTKILRKVFLGKWER